MWVSVLHPLWVMSFVASTPTPATEVKVTGVTALCHECPWQPSNSLTTLYWLTERWYVWFLWLPLQLSSRWMIPMSQSLCAAIFSGRPEVTSVHVHFRFSRACACAWSGSRVDKLLPSRGCAGFLVQQGLLYSGGLTGELLHCIWCIHTVDMHQLNTCDF